MTINGNGKVQWITIIAAIVLGFTSIIFSMMNRQIAKEAKGVRDDIKDLQKEQSDIKGRVSEVEGKFNLLVEKIDGQSELLIEKIDGLKLLIIQRKETEK